MIGSSYIKSNGVRRAVRVFQTWYFIPLFLNHLLPFDLNWEIDYLKTYLIIILFMFSIFLSFIFQRKTYSYNVISKERPVIIASIYLGAAILWVDFFYIRGISLNTISQNRDILEFEGPSFLTYIWIFFSALSVYNLINWRQGGITKNQNLIFPLILYSIPLLISGNRQYVFFILIYLSYYYLITSPKNFLSVFAKIFTLTVFLIIFFLAIQFARQDFASDDQANFISTINKIQCTNDKICDFSPNMTLLFLYIYAYFGNIYHGLTLVVSNSLETPLFSSTLTHLYSFIAQIFGITGIPQIINVLQSDIANLTGTFGGFWLSIFSSFYLDFGVIGLLILYLITFLSFSIVSRISNMDVSAKYYSFLLALLSFGLMYSPTAEFFLFILICLLIFEPTYRALLRK